MKNRCGLACAVATPGALVAHESPAADIAAPRWSSTTAAISWLAPIASSVTAPGVSCTEVIRGGSVELVHEPTTRTIATASSADSDGRERIGEELDCEGGAWPAGGTPRLMPELRGMTDRGQPE